MNKPLTYEQLYEKRGTAVLIASLDKKPVMYGMDRVAAVIDVVNVMGGKSIVAIYGDRLTMGGSDYGITWVAYDYNNAEIANEKRG